jgi:dipeptidase D
MTDQIRLLEPTSLWNMFADLNAVPRASKKEERVIAFMQHFGHELGLETMTDRVGNVIIKKPATIGMEDRKTIVMQSHLDMVHQKNGDTVFDFDTQGIEMFVDGDWVKAKGTTLGADNGIGVATIMAILAAKDIVHPAIEALFTIDEETGMTGAIGLDGGLLQGQILLNLDTEDDEEIDIGCAGGIDVTATRMYNEEKINTEGYISYQITIKGLNGGHSGMDIHKGLGNANKLMVRLLYGQYESCGLRIHELTGGSLRNAIPRESEAVISVPKSSNDTFISQYTANKKNIIAEFATMEANMTINMEVLYDMPDKCMDLLTHKNLINAIYAAHNGVFRMSPDIQDLVETSNNVARVEIQHGNAKVLCLSRSSVESSKWDVANTLRAVFELADCTVSFSGDYPGWMPNVKSPILEVLKTVYKDLNGKDAHVVACHAGLECGILGTNYPDMDMISFGPTIKGAHSPDEKVCISSVSKYWQFVLEVLKNIPKK